MTSDLVDYNIQVQELLTSDPPVIAFDVTYKVLDSEGKLEGEVSGHKFLLALASPVFRRGFYGADFKEKRTENIEMKGTTLKAFKAMISAMYRRPLDLETITLTETFELMNLAERYDLPKLKNKLKQVFEKMVISKDNVVEVANIAMKFYQLEEASEALLNNCANTLFRDLESKESVFKFCSSAYGTEDENIVMKLMSVLSNLYPPPCSNCQSTPCQSGEVITSVEQVRAGTVMVPNPNCLLYYGNWNMQQRKKYVVKSITEGCVMVKEGKGVTRYDTTSGYWMQYDKTPVFLFFCTK